MILKTAHLSDLHLTANDKNRLSDFKEILKSICEKKIDHLILTGDLIHNPEPSDYEILISILKKYGYFHRDKLSVCIGNHEIFGGKNKKISSIEFPTHCKYTDKNKMIRNFCDYFDDTFPANQKQFPYIKKIENIALYGLNSTADFSLKNNPVGSTGFIDDKNISDIKKLFNNRNYCNSYNIVLIHHHFYLNALNKEDEVFYNWLNSERNSMQLINRKNIINLFKQYNVKLVFHGHTHINEIYKKSGIRFINSSGSLIPFTKSDKNKYTIIDFLI